MKASEGSSQVFEIQTAPRAGEIVPGDIIREKKPYNRSSRYYRVVEAPEETSTGNVFIMVVPVRLSGVKAGYLGHDDNARLKYFFRRDLSLYYRPEA
jgi:hypothetical protein